jgi:hypothetical protein
VAYDEDLAGRVRAVLPPGAAVTERQMFGGLAFLLGGRDCPQAPVKPKSPPSVRERTADPSRTDGG